MVVQNVISPYTLAFIIVTAFVAASYLFYIFRRKEALNIIPLLVSIATVLLLYKLIGIANSANYYNFLSLDICLAILATIIAIFYISKPYIFITLIILFVIGILIYVSLSSTNNAFAGMFAIGTTYGMLYREFVLNPKRSEASINSDRKKRRTEINRDLVHLVLGIVLFAVLFFFSYVNAITVIFGLIIIGYTGNNLLANLRLNPSYRRAVDLERKNATYGLGATYLAASTALVIGFTNATSIVMFGLVVLFFADPLATIFGISARGASHLLYNKYKTYVGTLTFFIVAAIAGYYFIGLYGILFAAILAFVESINLSLDDNIRSGIVIVILSSLLGL